jgi:GT2 family glycosyltransferase
MTKVSIIIPNLEGADLLPDCIGALSNQGVATEVILVDNGSTDASLNIVERMRPDSTVISHSTNVGFAGAVSEGAQVASGDFLLFLNNDVVLPDYAIAELASILLENPDVGACQPTLRTPEGRLDSAGSQFTKTGFLHHLTEGELAGKSNNAERFALKGACLLVRREAYESSGGFDPAYFAYFEETDLCWRMRLTGWRLVHVESVTAVHGVGRTTTRLFSSHYIDYLSFRNRITTIRKNTGPTLRFRVLTPHVIFCVGIATAFFIRGRPRNALAIVKALKWHLLNGAEVKSARSRVMQLRKADDRCIRGVTVRMGLRYALDILRIYLVRW